MASPVAGVLLHCPECAISIAARHTAATLSDWRGSKGKCRPTKYAVVLTYQVKRPESGASYMAVLGSMYLNLDWFMVTFGADGKVDYPG